MAPYQRNKEHTGQIYMHVSETPSAGRFINSVAKTCSSRTGKMKKASHLVICPKCSNAVEMENLIQHINSHSAPLQKEQQIGERSKLADGAASEGSSQDQGA